MLRDGMTSGEHRHLLKQKIRNVGEWLIDNADDIVMDISGVTTLEINISLTDGISPLADNIAIKQRKVTSIKGEMNEHTKTN